MQNHPGQYHIHDTNAIVQAESDAFSRHPTASVHLPTLETILPFLVQCLLR
jgi:hypothetical protein